MRAKQRDFFERDREIGPSRSVHGGTISKGQRKVSRPLDAKRPVHLVLKSSHAKGKLSFLAYANRLAVESIIRTRAERFGIVIQGIENMGNHIHLIVKFKSRAMFQSFLRTVTGLIARHVTKARRGNPFGQRFFDHLAFTRIVQGARDFRGLIAYFFKNEVERDLGSKVRKDLEDEQRITRRESRKNKRSSPHRRKTQTQ